MILVVGIVTVSATDSEAERNTAHLSRFSPDADGRQFESATSASAVTTLHNSHMSTSTSINSITVQQLTTAISQFASNSHITSSTVVTSSSTNVVNSRCLPATRPSASDTPADVSDLLFDDQLLPQLPPPLIPIPDTYQPLVDIETSDLAANETKDTSTYKSCAVHQPRSPKTGECSVCMECEPNAALYPCGHMCLCYDCAIGVRKLHAALCPICRQPIIDILRIYRT